MPGRMAQMARQKSQDWKIQSLAKASKMFSLVFGWFLWSLWDKPLIICSINSQWNAEEGPCVQVPVQETGYWGTLKLQLLPSQTSMVHVSTREHPNMKDQFESLTVCAILCAGANIGPIGQSLKNFSRRPTS